MARIRLVLGALLVVVATAACSTIAPTVPLRTAAEPQEVCMLALLSGTLASNPNSGIGVRASDGTAIAVEWPFGYTSRNELGRLVLLDEAGKVLAREGDQVELGGGLGGDFWHACAGVTVTKPGG